MDFAVKSITKLDLAKHLEKELKCTRRASLRVVNSILAYLQHGLETGSQVRLSPFGTFIVRNRAGHRGKNPKTGETFLVKARSFVCFKPGKALKSLRPKW